jgi:hypothetical protein
MNLDELNALATLYANKASIELWQHNGDIDRNGEGFIALSDQGLMQALELAFKAGVEIGTSKKGEH